MMKNGIYALDVSKVQHNTGLNIQLFQCTIDISRNRHLKHKTEYPIQLSQVTIDLNPEKSVKQSPYCS